MKRSQAPMRSQLDREKCTGHGRCYVLAPAVYDADDEGYCVPRFEQIPDEFEEEAKRAALNCPEDALSIVEDS